MLKVNFDTCTGCTLCVKACPFAAIEITNRKAVILDNCTLCGACVPVCPVKALEIVTDKKAPIDISGYKGVWIVAEQKRGEVQRVTYELLGAGRQLADSLGTHLGVVVLGTGIEEIANSLISYGADKVYRVDSPELADYCDEPYSRIVTKLITKYKPEIVLCGATAMGRSLIPRVAVQIGTGLTADCTGLEIEEGTGLLLQTRPAFGGNIMATIKCEHNRPQMATVRSGVALDVEGTVSADRKYVTLTLRPEMATIVNVRRQPLEGGPAGSFIEVPEVESWKTTATVSIKDKATLVLIGDKVRNVRLPDGTTIEGPRRVVLLVKPAIAISDETVGLRELNADPGESHSR